MLPHPAVRTVVRRCGPLVMPWRESRAAGMLRRGATGAHHPARCNGSPAQTTRWVHAGTACQRGTPVTVGARPDGGPVVDMRSDTVTQPCAEMRAAMAAARVGDDVAGEDPSVNELETIAAEMAGKEAGLFVPTGTMGNMLSVGAHCQRGDEMILGKASHIFQYEQGGAAWMFGVPSYVLDQQADGTLDLGEVEAAVRDASDSHCPISRLVAVENTANLQNGVVLPRQFMRDLRQLANRHGLGIHVDGARAANAAVASGLSLAEVLEEADTVSICLSKGLGAPVGSVIVGSADLVGRARRLRKALGGGMRQAGIIAAGGTFALRHNIERLAQDHAAAKVLSDGLDATDGVHIMGPAETNILYFDVDPETGVGSEELVERLAARGVLLGGYSTTRLRAVTHKDVPTDGAEYAVQAIRQVLAEGSRSSRAT